MFWLGDIVDGLEHHGRDGQEEEVVDIVLWSVPF
jgi:hypothetical protein